MRVADLLLKYKTDKNHGTIQNIYNNLDERIVCENPEPKIGHTYGNSYDEIFENFDKNANLNILEIGIQKGGSLMAWKDYFLNSNIYGVDIVDCILDEYRRDDFNYVISDIKDDSVKEKFKNIMFDIIIDDGSHYLDDVLFVVENYLNKINKNGFLIIEDCQQPEYWLEEVKKLVPSGYEITIKDLRNEASYDNFLIIIKNDNN